MLSRRGGGVAGHVEQARNDAGIEPRLRNPGGDKPSPCKLTPQRQRQSEEVFGPQRFPRRLRMGTRPVAQSATGLAEPEKRFDQTGLARQDTPQAAAKVGVARIARIFAPSLIARRQHAPQHIPADAEKRAQDRQPADTRLPHHPRQARRSRAAQQTVQDGLSLVVGVMGEDNARESFFMDDALEQRKTRGTESRRRVGLMNRADLTLDRGAHRGRARQRKTGGEITHEPGVVAARPFARFVVEVRNVESQIRPVVEQQEHRHAVGSATYADGPAPRGNGCDHGGQIWGGGFGHPA